MNTIREWKQEVCAYIRASEEYRWNAAYVLLAGKEQFSLNNDEWETAKCEIAEQSGISVKTLQNWLAVAKKWPADRRERLDVLSVPFSVLAELTSVEEEKADALATVAGEQSWTRDQMRAELGKPIPAGGNGIIHEGEGYTWRHDNTVAIAGSNATADANRIVEAFGDEYAGELATALFSFAPLPY